MPNKHHTTASESVSRSNSYDDASMQDEQPPGYDEVTQSSVVVACTNGKCLGINLHTGATIWVSGSTIMIAFDAFAQSYICMYVTKTAVRLSWCWRRIPKCTYGSTHGSGVYRLWQVCILPSSKNRSHCLV